MSLRREIESLEATEVRNESPLDPAIYMENENSGVDTPQAPNYDPINSPIIFRDSISHASSSPARSNNLLTEFLPTTTKGAFNDNSCSLLNIWSIMFRSAVESLFYGSLIILPSIVTFLFTSPPWYNFFVIFDQNTPTIEFIRISFVTAAIYATWVITDALTKIIPLIVRRSWHLLKIPLPNSIKSSLAGWKSSRKNIRFALASVLSLLFIDLFVFGNSKLLTSATQNTTELLSGLTSKSDWIEKALIAATAFSILLLLKKVIMAGVTNSYRKEALAPRIIASNYKFRVLTRLFRQTDLSVIDARKSLFKESARDTLHSSQEEEDDTVEIIKDTAGIHLISEERAQSLASTLWASVCPIDRDYIVSDDLRSFFTADDALEAFAVFDSTRVGIVNCQTWKESVVAIWTERCNLQNSIRMSDKTLRILESIIGTIFNFLWALSVLSCVSPSGYTFISSTAGIVLTFGFLFKDSCERVFKSFIFVLVEHPYDVGDAVIIDKTRYSVIKMDLFVTTLKRHQDGTITYITNMALVNKYIYNEERSGISTDAMLVTLPSHIPLSALGNLQCKLHSFLSETFSGYAGNVKINPIEVQNDRMNIRVECQFQDSGEIEQEVKVARKESLSNKIQHVLNEMSISI